MKVWLVRNKDENAYYEIWTGQRPVMNKRTAEWVRGSCFLKQMCSKDFHRFCKIRLRKGQCAPIKLTHLKNGFKFEVIK